MNLDSTSGLHLRQLRVRLGTVVALNDVSFRIAPGEHLAIVGPSGAGKTTLLRAVAGLLRPHYGTVTWNHEIWSDATGGDWVRPENRRIGMIAQSLALWPHLTAHEHLTFVLKHRRVPREKRDSEARQLLERVHLSHRAGHRPAQLSGGEAQRLAFARSLAGGSRLLLLDEALGQLDPDLRRSLAADLGRVARQSGATILHVTHHPPDAMNLADRIAVLEGGRLTQLAEPDRLRAAPATRFIALLTGRTNLVPAAQASGFCDALKIGREERELITLPEGLLAFSPDDLVLAANGAEARVVGRSYSGERWLLEVEVRGIRIAVCAGPSPHLTGTVRIVLATPAR